MTETKISEAVPVACIHPDTLAMLQSDRRADRAACSPWSEIKEMDGYVPLYTHPQPAELAEQKVGEVQGDAAELLAEMRDVEDYFKDVDPNPIHLATVQAAIEALAARQPGG